MLSILRANWFTILALAKMRIALQAEVYANAICQAPAFCFLPTVVINFQIFLLVFRCDSRCEVLPELKSVFQTSIHLVGLETILQEPREIAEYTGYSKLPLVTPFQCRIWKNRKVRFILFPRGSRQVSNPKRDGCYPSKSKGIKWHILLDFLVSSSLKIVSPLSKTDLRKLTSIHNLIVKFRL